MDSPVLAYILFNLLCNPQPIDSGRYGQELTILEQPRITAKTENKNIAVIALQLWKRSNIFSAQKKLHETNETSKEKSWVKTATTRLKKATNHSVPGSFFDDCGVHRVCGAISYHTKESNICVLTRNQEECKSGTTILTSWGFFIYRSLLYTHKSYESLKDTITAVSLILPATSLAVDELVWWYLECVRRL